MDIDASRLTASVFNQLTPNLLCLDSNGYPHLIFNYGTAYSYIKWSGTEWVCANGATYDPLINNATVPFSGWTPRASLTLDSKNNPHIAAWGWLGGRAAILYTHWDGGAWVTASGIPGDENVSRTIRNAVDPRIQIDSFDRPHITWYQLMTIGIGLDVFYVRWDGSNWACANGVVYDPILMNANVTRRQLTNQPFNAHSFILDNHDNPVICSDDSSGPGNWELDCVRWDGFNWMTVNGTLYDPLLNNDGIINNPAGFPANGIVKIDSNNMPHFAWRCRYGINDICYMKWDGANFVTVDGNIYNPATGNARVTKMSSRSNLHMLELDSFDCPHLCWTDDLRNLYYIKHNGSNWVTVEDYIYNPTSINALVSPTVSGDSWPNMVLDFDDLPNLAWDNNFPRQLFFIKANPPLRFTSSSPQNMYQINDQVVFNLIADNPGARTYTNAEITDFLPPGLIFESAQPVGGSVSSIPSVDGTLVSLKDGPILCNASTKNHIELMPKTPNPTFFTSKALTSRASVTSSPTSPNAPMAAAPTKWTFHVGTILPGQRLNFTLYFKVDLTKFTGNEILYCTNNAVLTATETVRPLRTSTTVGITGPKLEITKTAKTFIHHEGDVAKFTIGVRNVGLIGATGVNVTDIFPKQLSYVASYPSAKMSSNGKLTWYMGDLAPGQNTKIEVSFKIRKLGSMPEGGMVLTNNGYAVCTEYPEVKDGASVLILPSQPGKELSIPITWKGIDTKTSTATLKEPITIMAAPTGGTSPYDIIVDWGDGTKSKKLETTIDDENIFEHAFTSTGDCKIVVTCTDSVGRSARVERKLKVK